METSTNEVPQSESLSNPSSQSPSPQSPPPSTRKMHPIYPPLLPSPDFFDLELEAEKLKDMFKATNSLKNPLYDETGLVKLPTDDKGVLILDPESKTRMIDVEVELDCLYEYLGWIGSAKKEIEDGGREGKEWLEGLRREVDMDMGEVFDEGHAVVDEERRKRGLTDRWTHWAHFKGQERKGEGANGEWVIKKAVNVEKSNERVAEVVEPFVLQGIQEARSASAQTKIPLARPEPVTKPVHEATSDKNGENVGVPVVVKDAKESDSVLENLEASHVQAEKLPVTTHAETSYTPPSAVEGTSLVAPALELLDLWW